MNNKHRVKQQKRQQQGFVLVISLILLAVLTLIGISSMNSANLELRATANAKQHQTAFNGVQSLFEYIMSEGGDASPTAKFFEKSDSRADHNLSGTSSLEATVIYDGCSVGIGNSLEAGKGFSYNFYEINGKGENETGTANSMQVQGVRSPSASC